MKAIIIVVIIIIIEVSVVSFSVSEVVSASGCVSPIPKCLLFSNNRFVLFIILGFYRNNKTNELNAKLNRFIKRMKTCFEH